MPELGSALLVFVLLCVSSGLGMFVRPRLPERHRTRETIELMQLTISFLVTFAALVLGLLTASVKQDFDRSDRDRQHYALQLTLLDTCLRDYGPEADGARANIHSYTAAVIASTWPSEPPPKGVRYPDTSRMPRVGASPVLAGLLNQVGLDINQLAPPDAAHARIVALCLDHYKDVLDIRLGVIEDARKGLFQPFYEILVFWLMIIFGCFGLLAPRNVLSAITIFLCAISLSSVMLVIVDLSLPYGGYFSISSLAMRNALATMMTTAP